MFGEIGPGTVVGDNFAAGVRFHLRLPLFVGLFEAFFKRFVALGEIVGVGRTHFAELVLDSFSDAQAVIGIEPIMRIAEGMDIPFGASNLAGGQLQNSGEARSVEIAGAAYLNAGVAGLSDQRRKPADFEFESDDDQELRLRQLQKKTGLRIDVMRILITARDRFDRNFIAANFLREGSEVGGGGHDLEFAVGASGNRKEGGEQQCEGSKQSADAIGKFSVSHISLSILSSTVLERMSAVRAHHEKKLEQKFVGVGKSVGRSGETPKAILTTNLAEFAGPIGDDAGETGIGEASIARVPAAIEAAGNNPTAIHAVFGDRIKAEGVLGAEQRGLEHGELVASAPDKVGAEEERVVDGTAKRLPAKGGVGAVKVGEEVGAEGVVSAGVREAKIKIGGLAEIAVRAEVADDADVFAAVCLENVAGIAAKNFSATFEEPIFWRGKETRKEEAGVIDAIFATNEVVGNQRAIDELQGMIVNGVHLAKVGALFSNFQEQTSGKRCKGDVRFFDVYSGFAKGNEGVGTRVGIDDGLNAEFGFMHFEGLAGRNVVVSHGADEIADEANIGIKKFGVAGRAAKSLRTGGWRGNGSGNRRGNGRAGFGVGGGLRCVRVSTAKLLQLGA